MNTTKPATVSADAEQDRAEPFRGGQREHVDADAQRCHRLRSNPLLIADDGDGEAADAGDDSPNGECRRGEPRVPRRGGRPR